MSTTHLGRAMVEEVSEPHFRSLMLHGAVGRITSLDAAWIRGAVLWSSVGRVEQNARAFRAATPKLVPRDNLTVLLEVAFASHNRRQCRVQAC